MIIPFLPLYLLDIGAKPENVNMWAGMVFSATFLVAAILAPYWGRCADRDGKRRMVIRAGLSLAVVYFLGALVRNPLELLLMRILQGVANGFVPASMSIVASTVPQNKLGFSLGVMQTALLIGSILGPLAGGVLSHIFGMRMSFVIAAGSIFLGTLAVRFMVNEPAPSIVTKRGSIIDDFKLALDNKRLLEMLVLLFLVQVATIMLQPIITLYVAELQGTLEGAMLTAGIVYSLAGVAGAIAAPLWGRLGQRKGFLRVLAAAFLGAGVFTSSQYLAPEIYSFGLLQFLLGLFVVGAYPAINTIAVTSTDVSFQGRIFGLTTTANQLGSMTGPLLGGFISAWMGIRPVFLISGSLLIITGFIVLGRHYQQLSGKEAA
jgi:DHA1 family multidrug resistance protein-like MFS transporter